MDPWELIKLSPQLVPLLPDIQRMLATIQRLRADPDLTHAIETVEKLIVILKQAGLR